MVPKIGDTIIYETSYGFVLYVVDAVTDSKVKCHVTLTSQVYHGATMRRRKYSDIDYREFDLSEIHWSDNGGWRLS